MSVHRVIAADVISVLRNRIVDGGPDVLRKLEATATGRLPDGALVYSGLIRNRTHEILAPVHAHVLDESEPFDYRVQHLFSTNVYLPASFGQAIADFMFWEEIANDRKGPHVTLLALEEVRPCVVSVKFDTACTSSVADEAWSRLQAFLSQRVSDGGVVTASGPSHRRSTFSFTVVANPLSIQSALWLGYSAFSLGYISRVREVTVK